VDNISFYLVPTAVATCRLWGCKNSTRSVFCPEVVKGVPNRGVDCSVSQAVFSVSLLYLWCMCCFVSLFLVVSISAVDCPERLRLQNDLLCVDWDITPYTLT